MACIRDINDDLANDVEARCQANKPTVGGELSLKGLGYLHSGTGAQHTAVRALVPCHIAYFRKPHAPQNFASDYVLGITRTTMRNKSLAQVEEEIGIPRRWQIRSMQQYR